MIKPTQNSFLIFLPKKDFNEEEFTTVKRRLMKSGKQVFITSDDHFACIGSKGMKVKSDTSFYNVNVNNFSAFILIGGTGSKAYWKNEALYNITKKFFEAKKVIAAICSSPITLAKAGILQNKKATCYANNPGINLSRRSRLFSKIIPEIRFLFIRIPTYPLIVRTQVPACPM